MEKEIIEGNKLIAVFDGKFVERIGEHRQVVYQGFNLKDHGVVNCLTEHLRYNSSWDWLMPVVEKIGTLHYPDYWSGNKPEDAGEFDDCPYPRTFGMRDKEGNYMVRFNANSLFSAPTLIEATFLAVVEFIKWYNDNKSNP